MADFWNKILPPPIYVIAFKEGKRKRLAWSDNPPTTHYTEYVQKWLLDEALVEIERLKRITK